MSAMASQITSVSIVYSTVCSGKDKKYHWPFLGEFTGDGELTLEMFTFDDITMTNNKHHDNKGFWS